MKMKHLLLRSLFFILFSSNVLAETYVREYTYNAFPEDDEFTSRTLAIDKVRTLLLKKIGSHINQTINISEDSFGDAYARRDVEAVTANLTKINIMEERWNKDNYYIKANIEADTQPILDALKEYKNEQSEEKKQLLKALKINELRLQKTREKIDSLRREIEHSNYTSQNTIKLASYKSEIEKLSTEKTFSESYIHHQNGEYDKAIKMYRQIAKQGNSVAQQLLGSLYMNGKGLEKDYSKAIYWFKKAAKQDEAIAQYYLGILYLEGKGVRQDFTKAYDWFHKSAEHEDALAQYQLGNMYLKGNGVEQQFFMAAHWFRKAADHQEAVAQLQLGHLYSQGKGLAQNKKEALYWYNKAAEQGLKEATVMIDNLNIEIGN